MDKNAISRRAYEIWEAEGRPNGRDVQHWHEAEAEMTGTTGRSGRRRGSASGMGSNGTSNHDGEERAAKAGSEASKTGSKSVRRRGTTIVAENHDVPEVTDTRERKSAARKTIIKPAS